jgi:hypothetical protein
MISSFHTLNLSEAGQVFAVIVGLLLSTFVFVMFQGAITYAIFMLLLDVWTSAIDSFKNSASRIPRVFLSAVMIFFSITLISAIPLIVLLLLGPVFPGLSIVVAMVGALAVFIVMFYITSMCYVFAPACIIENVSAIDSLKRSSELTKGYRLKIVGIILLMFGTSRIIGFIIGLIFGQGFLDFLFSTLVMTILFSYFCLLPAITYYNLRAVKEGFTLNSLYDDSN